jgi:hypothetical protein
MLLNMLLYMLLTWPLFVRRSSSSVKLLLSVLVNVNEDVRRFIMCLPKRSFSGCGSKGVDSWAAALMQTTVRCHALEALHRLHCHRWASRPASPTL